MNKNEIMELMSQDLGQALSILKVAVKKDSSFYLEVILSEGALNELNSHLRKGLISYTENLSEIGKLRFRILSMIDKVPESYFTQIEEVLEEPEEIELGIFDYFVEGHEALSDMTEVLTIISENTTGLGDEITEEILRFESIKQVNPEGQKRTILLQKILERIGDKMRAYNLTIIPCAEVLELKTKSSVSYISNGIRETYKSQTVDSADIEDLLNLREALSKLISSTEISLTGQISLRDEIQKIPKLQSGLNIAKKETAITLSRIIATIEEFREIVVQSKFEIEHLLLKNKISIVPASV